MTLNLPAPIEARLHERAQRENRSLEEVVTALLMRDEDYSMPGAIEEGSLEETQAIREGLADIAAGRYRTLTQYVSDLKTRHRIEL